MKIVSPAQAHRYLRVRFRTDIEEFWAIALNSQKDLLAAECLFRGTVDVCLFHPRDLFRFAYRNNASAVIVAHNHPSGCPEPSHEDRQITRQLATAARILQVPVIDHLILAGDEFFSFLAAGELPELTDPWPDDRSLD